MKASRLIFTLLLASSVAVVQLAAQQTKADQKPIEEVKAKAEAGDAESEVELGLRYDKGAGVVKDHAEAALILLSDGSNRRFKFHKRRQLFIGTPSDFIALNLFTPRRRQIALSNSK
jgi:hypothetical protein